MNRLSKLMLRKKVLPVCATAVVLLLVVVSYNASLQGPNQSFSFGVYWPNPTSYHPGYTSPNVYFGINYTGPGVRNFTFSIFSDSAVLASGQVPVAHDLPFRELVVAPIPSNLRVLVSVNREPVYRQNFTLA
jgi:hypothetical protein